MSKSVVFPASARSSSIAASVVVLAMMSPVPAPGAKPESSDALRTLQTEAIAANQSPAAHWGTDPANYKQWGTHSNRLIPLYTFGTAGAGKGIDLDSYTGANSVYRNAAGIHELYGYDSPNSLNPAAEYCDQTDVYRIQKAALDAGKKHIILIIFDGTDWQTTRAAAIYRTGKVGYDSGRGSGLHLQDYKADGTTQFGFMVTSPHNDGTDINVDLQTVLNPNGKVRGGYNVELGGPNPWTPGSDIGYLIARPENKELRHAYTDSSTSACSMTAGLKSYNNCVNVDYAGRQVQTIAHEAQQQGYSVGAVTSVPISHATPAASYAHNVDRDDYQDLTRDLIGRPSISHPEKPLPGLDVLIGTGFGVSAKTNKAQGEDFVPGNIYLTDADREAIDQQNGGRYVVATRTEGEPGGKVLRAAAAAAAKSGQRLLGFFGTPKGHLPFATADGDFQPAPGRNDAEKYTEADLLENPTLVDMADSAMEVLSKNPNGFWLMVEAGDVDWANHDDNLDNSIGAVLSGDAAVKAVTDWVEKHSNWKDSVVIVTADHGHYLMIDRPEMLIDPATTPK